MSIKNAIINHTNTQDVPVPAEIQARYASSLLVDPTDYNVAVTSTSIDISEMPILTFSDSIDSLIKPVYVLYHESDDSFGHYHGGELFNEDVYNFKGMSFKNIHEFYVQLQEKLDGHFRFVPQPNRLRGLEFDVDPETFEIEYKMDSGASHALVLGFNGYRTFVVTGELVNIFKAYPGKMVNLRYGPNESWNDGVGYLVDFRFPTTFEPAYAATPDTLKPKSDIMTNLYNWSALVYKTDMSINATSYYHETQSPGGRDEPILLYINLPRLASPYIIYSPDQLRWNSFTNDIDISSIYIKVFIVYNNGSMREVMLAPGGASNVQMSFRKNE